MPANIENVKAQVIEELEQVIEKDKQVQADETDEEAGGGAVPEKEDLLSDALHTQGLVDEEGLRTRNQKCAGARRCMGTTWDVMRSVPLLTFVWAAGAIYATNMAVTNVEKVASQMQVFHYFKQIFRVMDWGLAYIDFVDAFVAVLAILFSGATLELFVGRFCKFDGCYRHFSRFSFRTLQGLFFPAAYVGFLASMALLVSTVILASTVVMTNMACGIATTPEGTAAAASQLSSQISLVTHWFAIKSVAISPEDLASYCATTTLNTTWFWRMTFIYVTAAAICQVNLAVTMWTVYLTTGFEIRRGDLVRRHNATIAKYQMERKRPASGDFSKRPLSGDFNNGLRGNWTGGNEGKEDIEA